MKTADELRDTSSVYPLSGIRSTFYYLKTSIHRWYLGGEKIIFIKYAKFESWSCSIAFSFLRLRGAYVGDGCAGLTLPPRLCVSLSGRHKRWRGGAMKGGDCLSPLHAVQQAGHVCTASVSGRQAHTKYWPGTRPLDNPRKRLVAVFGRLPLCLWFMIWKHVKKKCQTWP